MSLPLLGGTSGEGSHPNKYTRTWVLRGVGSPSKWRGKTCRVGPPRTQDGICTLGRVRRCLPGSLPGSVREPSRKDSFGLPTGGRGPFGSDDPLYREQGPLRLPLHQNKALDTKTPLQSDDLFRGLSLSRGSMTVGTSRRAFSGNYSKPPPYPQPISTKASLPYPVRPGRVSTGRGRRTV